MAREHKDIEDPNIHEPKGAGLASVNETIVADGAGSTEFKSAYLSGVYDYNDTGSAITLTPISTPIKMTNNGLGTFTNLAYTLPSSPNVWDTSTSQFDFSNLSLGDTVFIRVDFNIVTTAANTVITPSFSLAIGSGSPYTLNFGSRYFKSSGTYNNVAFEGKIYMGDVATKDNPCEILLSSDAGSATSNVNGWAITVIKRSPEYV